MHVEELPPSLYIGRSSGPAPQAQHADTVQAAPFYWYDASGQAPTRASVKNRSAMACSAPVVKGGDRHGARSSLTYRGPWLGSLLHLGEERRTAVRIRITIADRSIREYKNKF